MSNDSMGRLFYTIGKMSLAVDLREIVHEGDQGFNAFQRHRVVDAGAETADGTMALDADQASFLRFFHELRFELFVAAFDAERDVHQRTGGGIHRTCVERAGVDGGVQFRGLLFVLLLHGDETAVGDQPVGDEADHVDAERARRVEQGTFVDVRRVAQHGRNRRRATGRQVFADDDDSRSGRTDVLLGTGEDDTEFIDVERTGHEIAGHIRDERDIARFGEIRIFGTVDRVVAADMDIGQILVDLPVFDAFDLRELFGLAVVDQIDFVAEDLHFLHGLVGPFACVADADLLAGDGDVHRNHRELETRAALQEQNRVVVADVQQTAEVGFGGLDDFVKGFRAMAFLDDAVTTATIVNKLFLSLQHH